jgi:hypothetical protein
MAYNKEYSRGYYQKNRELILAKSKIYGKENRKENRERLKTIRKKRAAWFAKLKCGLRCKDCGESHPACLDFHHRNPKEKLGNISFIVTSAWSEQRILKEIAKCDILCVNCHRKLHCKREYVTK